MTSDFADAYKYDALPEHMRETDGVIVLRHGPLTKDGYPSDSPGDSGDRQRPLTTQGSERLSRLGRRLLVGSDYASVRVKVSDFRRTMDSARAFVSSKQDLVQPPETFESLGYSRPNFLDNLIEPKFGHDKPTADEYVVGMLEKHFFGRKANPATPTVSALMYGLAEAMENSLYTLMHNKLSAQPEKLHVIVTHGGGIVDLMPLLASGAWNKKNPNTYLSVDFENGVAEVDRSKFPGHVATAEPAFASIAYTGLDDPSIVVESKGLSQGYKLSDISRVKQRLKQASQTYV